LDTWELAPTALQCDGAGSALSRGWSSSSSFTVDSFSDLSSSQITSTNQSVCVHSMFGHVTFNTFVVVVQQILPAGLYLDTIGLSNRAEFSSITQNLAQSIN
jgi:hypothetical protein